MPNKTLSFHDYVLIIKERMRGLSQEQVAKKFNVSVSLIGKLEKHNKQYQEIRKHLQTSIIDETGRFIAQAEKPAADFKKFIDAQAKAIAHTRSEIQKPVEAVVKVIGQIESMRSKIRKPVEAVAKTIDQIESLGTEIQKPAADFKKFIDAQAKVVTHMRSEIQKPVEAVAKTIDQIESLGTESEIKELLLKLSDQFSEEQTMLNFDMYNESFEGFRIKGIDTTNLPSSTDNPGEYRLLLDPISGLGTAEEQEFWGNCFNNNETVANWRWHGASLPHLEYIPTDPMLIVSGYRGYIQASNTNPEFLDHYAPRMKKIVAEANEVTRQLIQERSAVRNNINDINATHFQNN